MEEGNLTSSDDFFIVGFSDLLQLQVPLFAALLMMYLLTMMGNLLIMAIVYYSANLHTPMYFFLTNLSFLDISYTSFIFPQMLAHFFFKGTYMSLTECLLQVYFFVFMVSTEFLLLAVMAVDRYMAICNPLHYMTIMNKAVCFQLAVGSWVVGLTDAIPHTVLMSGLSYCQSHIINHLYCDGTALMKLSCTSTHTIEVFTYVIGAFVGLMPFVLIITTYIKIISTVLQIQSPEGRRKAFSTCASHLTVVILFYGSVCTTYMRPTSSYSIKENKILSLSYIIVTPLCNPIIYSLKNTEFKNALKKATHKFKIGNLQW
ncbi:olfactory receptor 5V1-like [Lissotriton helveticus]